MRGVWFLGVFLLPVAFSGGEEQNRDLARIGGELLDQRTVEACFMPSFLRIRREYTAGKIGEKAHNEQVQRAWADAVDGLIEALLLHQQGRFFRDQVREFVVRRLGSLSVEASRQLVGEKFRQIEAKLLEEYEHLVVQDAGGKEQFTEVLRAHGLSLDRWREMRRREIFVHFFLQWQLDPRVTEKEKDEYRQKYPEIMEVPEGFVLRRLLLKIPRPADRETLLRAAELARQKLEGGDEARFAQLCRALSDGPHRERGGLLPPDQTGYTPASQLEAEDLAQARQLQPGQISPRPYEAGESVRLLWLVKHRPAKKLAWSEVERQVVWQLREAKEVAARKKLFDELKQKTTIFIKKDAHQCPPRFRLPPEG